MTCTSQYRLTSGRERERAGKREIEKSAMDSADTTDAMKTKMINSRSFLVGYDEA